MMLAQSFGTAKAWRIDMAEFNEEKMKKEMEGKLTMMEPITAVELTKTDLCILDSYTCLAKGLSEYLGTGYEIVVQSLGNPDEGVICIMNGHYTGRKIGAPITDFALEMFERIKSHDGTPYASYFTENKNGEPIRSTTIAIHGENHRVIGFICINFFLNLPLATFIRENYFSEHLRVFSETFAENSREIIEKQVVKIRDEVFSDKNISLNNKNKEIIFRLSNCGIFNLKDSVVLVAEQLGISKNTVYLHLRNCL